MTAIQLKKIVSKYLKKWKTNLFLGMWKIDFNIRSYLSDDGNGHSTAATCDSSWKYFTATINFSLEQMEYLSEDEIEKIVIHELLHIVVNEMREDGIEHEERVTSHLQMIMSWMDRK